MQLEAKTQVMNAEIHKKKNISSFLIWVVKSEKRSNIPPSEFSWIFTRVDLLTYSLQQPAALLETSSLYATP